MDSMVQGNSGPEQSLHQVAAARNAEAQRTPMSPVGCTEHVPTWKSPAKTGLFCSRPVSRIVLRVAPAGAAKLPKGGAMKKGARGTSRFPALLPVRAAPCPDDVLGVRA